MKKIIFLLITIVIFLPNGNSQRVELKGNYLNFPTIADYEYFANNPENRGVIDMFSETTLLKNQGTLSDEIPEFLLSILNQDFIVKIGSYLIRLDFLGKRGLAINLKHEDAYNRLLQGNSRDENIMLFSMQTDNALEILEAIEAGSLKEDDYKTALGINQNVEGALNRCVNPDGQEVKRFSPWGNERQLKDCKIDGISVLWGDLKLVYQKALIYFSLQSKEKCREACKLGGDPATAGTVSVFMFLQGTVRYQACTRNEIHDARNSNFSYTNEKSWRPYEGSRRLIRYDFTVQFKMAEDLATPTTFPLMNIKAGY